MSELGNFFRVRSNDIFAKCRKLQGYIGELREEGLYETNFRLQLQSGLGPRVVVKDPFSGQMKELICFDSNSYLGLHHHPRVLAAVRATLDVTGYGTPSAQLLAGTNKWLAELEETVADFHGRSHALIFPSGYATNIGVLTGLLRPGDTYACDRMSHASIHDGCRYSGAKGGTYQHANLASLERLLKLRGGGSGGRLIATDGVFSMHGGIAPLPGLLEIARRHGARLMIDEAHSVGVLGRTGRGLEEHFECAGEVDILMGTFSKAPGAAGGYICGSVELIDYLRFFARSNMFTASLPAPICAGVTAAFRVMAEEKEHRERLWSNSCRLHRGLEESGFVMEPLETPILTITVGDDARLFQAGRDLYDAGLKCGSVTHPAVPRGGGRLRLSVNAAHSEEDIDRAVEIVAGVAKKRGFLALRPNDLHLDCPRRLVMVTPISRPGAPQRADQDEQCAAEPPLLRGSR